MSKRKIIVLTIISALLIFAALWIFVFPIDADFIPAETCYNSSLRLPTQRTSDMMFSTCPIGVRFSTNGTIYILTEDGELKEQTEKGTKTIASDVQEMLPTDRGVLYTVLDTLYLAEQGETTVVAENVDGFSYNSSDLIYSTNRGLLYAWRQGEARLVAELPDNYTEQIFANDTFTVWIGSSDILCFNNEGESEEIPILCGSPNQYFLYNQWLVVVGDGKTSAGAYSLETKEHCQIGIGWYANEHDNRISVTCSEDKLYLSIHSELWPKLGDEIRTATLCIDPQNWSVEKMSEKFYDALAISDNKLYGLETSFFVNEWELVG